MRDGGWEITKNFHFGDDRKAEKRRKKRRKEEKSMAKKGHFRAKMGHFCPFSKRVLAVGHMGILLSLGCLRILLDSPLRGEALLYAEAYAGSVGGFLVVLWGVALGIDLLERACGSD